MSQHKPESNWLTSATVGRRGNVLEITLARPDKANAYNRVMLQGIAELLGEIKVGGVHRAVLIRASGQRAFCAGADRDELDERTASDAFHLYSRQVFDQLASLPVPTVAALSGPAVGGGFELAMACDIRTCALHTTFHLPELTLGLSPAAGGLRRLQKLVGGARATEVALFGKKLDAATAHVWGLVSYYGGEYERAAVALAEFAAEQDPIALAANKAALAVGYESHTALEAITQALLYERRTKKENATK